VDLLLVLQSRGLVWKLSIAARTYYRTVHIFLVGLEQVVIRELDLTAAALQQRLFHVMTLHMIPNEISYLDERKEQMSYEALFNLKC
jgi:hypothetical protein